MYRGLAALLVPLLAGTIAAQAVGVGTASRSHAKKGHSVSVEIPLPGPGTARITELTVEVTSRNGAVGSGTPSIRDANEAELPPGIRAVTVTSGEKSEKHSATFNVDVVINNLTGRVAARAASDEVIVIEAGYPLPGREVHLGGENEVNCTEAVDLGNAVDASAVRLPDGKVGYGRYRLQAQQSETLQPSDDEAVLDDTVFEECKDTPGVENPETDGESDTDPF